MAIAGVVIVPEPKKNQAEILEKLTAMPGVDHCEPGPDGVAVVIEAKNSRILRRLSEEINDMDEVAELQLVYLNWEDEI